MTTDVAATRPSLVSTMRRGALHGARITAWAIFAMAWGQIATAGYGLFAIDSLPMTDAGSLDAHRLLGYATEIVGLVLVALVVAAWPRWFLLWPTLTLLAVLMVQPVLQRLGDDVAMLGAVHAANAIVTIGLSLLIARRAAKELTCHG
ncbi:hypothetical protein ATJ88_0013 [Isoptericola jiangsuensis]|uniref:Uncharacterized protein n=1 Tax=Isoptericola jiangsuensis TaxID=548579 RepID=A0A2A9ER86_9MICO|nr:hypothetical protein [Isoptericola jiangsuensis]PFG41378.1 hypothetical protein ATJ88_0013 [Isoptericola jiangsuensis]